MENKIILFTMEGCEHCSSLKDRLSNSNIEYTILDIDDHYDMWNKLVEETGYDYLPMTVIIKENKDNGIIYIPGRDYQTEDEIFKIIQNCD